MECWKAPWAWYTCFMCPPWGRTRSSPDFRSGHFHFGWKGNIKGFVCQITNLMLAAHLFFKTFWWQTHVSPKTDSVSSVFSVSVFIWLCIWETGRIPPVYCLVAVTQVQSPIRPRCLCNPAEVCQWLILEPGDEHWTLFITTWTLFSLTSKSPF